PEAQRIAQRMKPFGDRAADAAIGPGDHGDATGRIDHDTRSIGSFDRIMDKSRAQCMIATAAADTPSRKVSSPMADGQNAPSTAPLPGSGAPADTRRNYLIGIAMGLIGSACLSIAGVTMRHVEQADGWQMLFYRSIIFAATILLWLLLRYRTRTLQAFQAIGRLGLLVAVVMGISFVGYLVALAWAQVATAMVVMSSGPVFAALFG